MRSAKSSGRLAGVAGLLLAGLLGFGVGKRAIAQQGAASQPSGAMSSDTDAGSADIEVKPFLLPASTFSSPEARALLAEMLKRGQSGANGPGAISVTEQRDRQEHELQPAFEQAKQLYPVKITGQVMGGVAVDVIIPASGTTIRHRHQVLIELAPGAFTTATRLDGLVEAIPVAGLGGYRVVSVHYRQGPEFRFPAASEDVAAVYSQLLKHYKAKSIGIYGCSAGAYLTTMSLAWFQAHRLPVPGAAALLCGSGGRIFEGDTFYTGAALMGRAVPHPVTPQNPVVQVEYMRDVKTTDPLALPVNFPEVLAKFPPTLFITGSRDVALSSAVYLHTRLTALGVKADLHVWDGMWHDFMSAPALPESRQAAEVISTFFDRELAR